MNGTNQFFTVNQWPDGRWSFIDSEGNPLYSLGVNCFNYHNSSPMEPVLRDKYGGRGWFERWAESKLAEVWEHGFNTLGAWHFPYYFSSGRPMTIEINCSRGAKMVNDGWGGYGFPDVFDPSFRMTTHAAMVDMFYNKGVNMAENPNVIGWFTDNELHWWGSGGRWGQNEQASDIDGTGLVDDYIALKPDRPGKKAWVEFLAGRYGKIERLNAAWNAEYGTFEELLWLRELRVDDTNYAADKKAFLRLVAETYFETTADALRQYDANHLHLGCRFVGTSTPDIVLEVMGKYVDAWSLNFYCFDLPQQWMERACRIAGKPCLITEFSFCEGPGAGFDLITNGAQLAHVPNQKRRGECYREFVMQAARMPFVLGAHWFALYDFWHYEGLIGNYGLYDKEDRLWAEFAGSVKEANAAALAIRMRAT